MAAETLTAGFSAMTTALDLDGETAARDEAALVATEMAGGLANLDPGELAVEVRDQNGQPTCELEVSISVSRH